jgi:hypothetical protein
MALITDPDNLIDAAVDSAQNIFINTATRTIQIRNNVASGNVNKGPELSNDGVTHQSLYSFLKEQWKNDPKGKNLIAYPFPLIAITPEQFEWRFGWSPADDSSRSFIRTGGWREFDVDNSTQLREYIGTISLGNIQGTPTEGDAGSVNQHKVYYGFFNATTGVSVAGPTDYTYSGEANQAIETYRDLNGDGSPDFDYRTRVLRLFIRSQPYTGVQNTVAWTFDQTDTTDIGIIGGTTLPFNTQRFPLVEGEDLNIKDRDGASVTDAVIAAADAVGQKYSLQGDGPTIDYLAADEASNTFGYTQDLLGGPFNFGVKIDATSPTVTQLSNSELYSWVQYNLRQDSDIEFAAGTVKNGKLADELLAFVGPTLTTKLATNLDQSGTKTGVAVTNIRPADINNTQLRDTVNNALQSFPFSSTVTVTFSSDILADSDQAKASVYYDYTREYTGTSVDISGAGAASVFGSSSFDSATITLSGFTTTPLSPTNSEGLVTTATPADAYFKLTGATNADNNVIFGVTQRYTDDLFSVITLDDTPTLVDETITGGTIRTHPINSPSALLVDSAGTIAENTGGVVSLLATPPLYQGNERTVNASDELVFSYAYDGNTQKDRVSGADIAINVRALGLASGQWVEQRATVQKVDNNPVSVISAVERNYSNPV